MEKYFKEEQLKEILLSEYLKKDASEFEKCIFSECDRITRTEYLIDILGDVSLDRAIYELFIKQFQCFGGKYDVRTKPDTIRGIYNIIKKYSMLTEAAISEIWFIYIKDLYEEYELLSVLDKYIEIFGKKDETFKLFIDYVEKKSDQHQQRYIEDSLQADELKEEYGEKFTNHVKSLIRRKHYTYDEIKKYLPSSELVKKDEQQLIDISTKTRIFIGCCEPVSYTMLDILLEYKTLDLYSDKPTYYISSGKKELATFTKQEFLNSISKEKIKKLQRNKR